MSFMFEGVTYNTHGDWEEDLRRYGYTMVNGMRPRTDMYGPGTNRRQHSQIELHADGTLKMLGYSVGQIEIAGQKTAEPATA